MRKTLEFDKENTGNVAPLIQFIKFKGTLSIFLNEVELTEFWSQIVKLPENFAISPGLPEFR